MKIISTRPLFFLSALTLVALPITVANVARADPLSDVFEKFEADVNTIATTLKVDEDFKKLENAKRQANADIKRLSETLKFVNDQAQKNSPESLADLKADKKRIETAVKKMQAIIKDLAGRSYKINDAWLKTTVKADFVNYGDTLVVFDGVFANKKIKFPMQWNFQDTPSNIEKLGRAILSASYSTSGVSNLDLKFLKPKPWATLTCMGSNYQVSVQGDVAKVDTPAVSWTVNAGDDGQRWVLDPDGTIATKIDNQQELVLDILLPPAERSKKDAVIESGTKMALNAKGGKLTQRWAIKKIKKYHVIVNQKTGFGLDCGAKPANGAPLTVTELAEVPTQGQRWQVVEIKTKDR